MDFEKIIPEMRDSVRVKYDALAEVRCLKCGSQLIKITNGYKCSRHPDCDFTAVANNSKASKLNEFWMRLNGNKTYICAGLWIIATVAFPTAAVPIGIIGGALTGTAGAHKGVKALKKKNGDGKEGWIKLIINFLLEIFEKIRKGV